ncbi:hypothetical protein [Microbacterium plantarum]|uniref:DUF2020 domain-containing protein n=1 Tax=Microbacterium plantarum TaxID=1816425 RepID=A0ABV5EPC8_9MICO
MGRKQLGGYWGLAAAVALVMTGCSAATDPASSPSPATSTSTKSSASTPPPTPSQSADAPTPDAMAPSLDGVSCDELVPSAIVDANFTQGAVPSDPWRDAAAALPDEPARLAAEAAGDDIACAWAFPGGSDGGVEVYGLTLTPDARDALVAELRDTAVFSEGDVEGAATFTRVEDGEVASQTVGYLFDESVWIAFVGNSAVESFDRDYVPAMLTAIRP